MATIVKPPVKIKSIFLAGSIEMGTAENWQHKIEEALKDLEVTIYNPRRDDWDSGWIQSKHNKNFREQVEWELENLEKADYIVMYFDENTKSPISMLELGLFAKSKKLILYCPDKFWRKGNIDVVCDKYKIYTVNSLDDLILAVKEKIKK